MASHGSRSPSPPSTPSNRRVKSCARRCERGICTAATYFPLVFVYSLTTWAVYVDASIGFHKEKTGQQTPYSKKIPSAIGVILYILLNASYTTAVFKDPGSPTNSSPSERRGRYSVLPTTEPHDLSDVQTITVSSSGGARYCKKCHVSKPDRTHHCSTCKRCVLKMDHHCPWLATCLGLHNYKAFLLFLIYVSLFCWACFFNTAYWVWHEIFEGSKYLDQFAPVNVILLAVLSGIIGLVITGFTCWHLYLTLRGQTTIECLEKTRYLRGVRRTVEANRQEHASHNRNNSEGLANNLKRIGDQVLEFHANAVPGASRFEEGEEHTSPTPSEAFAGHSTPSPRSNTYEPPTSKDSESPAQRALRSSYRDYENQRESDRYEEYMLEQESAKLPNAFDLGWRKNLGHVFGPSPFLWWLPVCNTTGNGWRWEVSDKWVKANEEANRKREDRLQNAQAQSDHQQQQQQLDSIQLRGGGGGNHYYDPNTNGRRLKDSYEDSAVSMHTLRRPGSGRKMKRDFDTDADGETGTFQVSGSEDESDESDLDVGQISSKTLARRQEGGGEWGRRW